MLLRVLVAMTCPSYCPRAWDMLSVLCVCDVCVYLSPSLYCVVLCFALIYNEVLPGLGWAGLGWTVNWTWLCWNVLGWLGCAELGWAGLGRGGLDLGWVSLFLL